MRSLGVAVFLVLAVSAGFATASLARVAAQLGCGGVPSQRLGIHDVFPLSDEE